MLQPPGDRDPRTLVACVRHEGVPRAGCPIAGVAALAYSPDGRRIAYSGFDLGVYVKRLGGPRAREIAPTQLAAGGSVVSFDPAWRPLVR